MYKSNIAEVIAAAINLILINSSYVFYTDQTAYPSGAPELTPGCSVTVLLDL